MKPEDLGCMAYESSEDQKLGVPKSAAGSLGSGLGAFWTTLPAPPNFISIDSSPNTGPANTSATLATNANLFIA